MKMEEREERVYSTRSKLGSVLHVMLIIALYVMAYKILGRLGLLFMAIFMSTTYGIRLLLKKLFHSFWFVEYGEFVIYGVVFVISLAYIIFSL